MSEGWKALRHLRGWVKTRVDDSKSKRYRNMFSISRLHAVMKEVPRKVFDAEVHAQGSDKYSKRLNSWSQLVAMIYAQLSGAASLRITEAAYNGQAQHHYHLGTGEVRRSTLADANRQRSPDPFAATARALMARAPRALRRDGAEFCICSIPPRSR